MALPVKQKLPDDYIEEMQRYIEITQDGNRTTSGQAVYTNPRTLASYTTVGSAYDGQGEQGLGLLLYNVNTPQLSNYVLDVDTYNAIQTEINTATTTIPTETVINTGFASGWSGEIRIRKNKENLKTLVIDLTKTTDIVSNDLPYTLGLAYRPYNVIQASVFGQSSAALVVNSQIFIIITTDGGMYLYNVGGVTANVRRLRITVSYY